MKYYNPAFFLCLLFLLAPPQAHAQHWACQGKAGCAAPGSVCPDDTIFAGCAPTTYTPLYTTRCDGGRTWNGAACTGTAVTIPYNNGNATNRTDIPTAANNEYGAPNTTALVAADSDSGTGGTQPHQAAAYCDGLTIHGHSDWYLPARYELTLLRILAVYDLNIFVADYWSSSQNSTDYALFMSTGHFMYYHAEKQDNLNVRCIRRP